MPGYRVTYLVGTAQKVRFYERSPKDDWLLRNAQAMQASLAVRYWPSKRAWRVLDARSAKNFMANGSSYFKWVGHFWLDRKFDTEDAAIMYALVYLQRQPQLI